SLLPNEIMISLYPFGIKMNKDILFKLVGSSYKQYIQLLEKVVIVVVFVVIMNKNVAIVVVFVVIMNKNRSDYG
ncbi:MAG: hypothetical protein WB217_02195, partial [Mesobacillus sp.]|uniref:hypothetical protein n=1 Tax=Mesobacillus sp. TaxID=2675271 RepID=UPI003C4415DB